MDDQAIYKIGSYTCQSKEEYELILRDIKIIKTIKNQYHFEDPNIAKKILTLINKNDVLHSKLGLAFKKQLAEIIQLDNLQKEYVETQPVIKQLPQESVINTNSMRTENKDSDNITQLNCDKTIKAKTTPKTNTKINTKEKGIEIPIIIPASNLRNCVSILSFATISTLLFYLSYKFDEQYGLALMSIILIYLIVLGCKNISHMNKAAKMIAQLNPRKDEEDEENAIFTCLFTVVLIILCVIFPPLFFVLLIIRAIISALPKLKWLSKNIKSGIIGFLIISYMFFLIEVGEYVKEERNEITTIPLMRPTIILSVFFISLLMIIIASRIIKKQTYLSIRTMATFPIMLFLTLLPFIGIGLMVYAYVNSNDNNTVTIGDPGVYEVSGHYRHTPSGGLTYVDPYLRTYPDGILTNNLSFKS
ncbi:MAG: hypothetical protein K0S47_4251 [Herbinix sp.]|jgi:hypothetical protein|nr:hypothetical protein [Herbinix sp.]